MFPFILLAPGLKLLVQKGNGEIGLCCTRSLEKLGPGDLSGHFRVVCGHLQRAVT